MSDFLVAGLVVLALAAVANFGTDATMSPSCRADSGWSVRIC